MNKFHPVYQAALEVALVTAFLLMIPLIGVVFETVNWTGFDFLFAGTIIFCTGFTYKLITMQQSNVIYRIATGLGLASGLFLIWSNLAVGLIGSEDNPANAMYLAVIAIGVIGVVAAKFKAAKMAYALFGMAATQLIITLISISLGLHNSPGSSVTELLSINGFFITLFVVSGLLFQWAAEENSQAKA